MPVYIHVYTIVLQTSCQYIVLNSPGKKEGNKNNEKVTAGKYLGRQSDSTELVNLLLPSLIS